MLLRTPKYTRTDTLFPVTTRCRSSAGPKGYDFGGIDFGAWYHVLQVNALGPLRVAEAFVDAVARSERKEMVFVSSIMGSIAENEAGRHYMYRSSKAGLNAAVKSLSIDLKPRGITRSEERRGGQESVSTCRSWRSTDH